MTARAWLAFVPVWLVAAGLIQSDTRIETTPVAIGASAAPDTPRPSTYLWYTHPSPAWDDALPVGNGRLGGMVFGRVDEEEIGLNEDTYWSGGPYSTTVPGASAALPEVRRL